VRSFAVCAAQDDKLRSCGGRTALLPLRRGRRLEAEDCFAVLHQVEAIAGYHFEVTGICLEQIHFARLPREQHFLVSDLRFQDFDFAAALRQLFVLRQKETNDNKDERDGEKPAKDAIGALPDGGLATRTKIAVAGVIH
jgi:hypothetical protein